MPSTINNLDVPEPIFSSRASQINLNRSRNDKFKSFLEKKKNRGNKNPLERKKQHLYSEVNFCVSEINPDYLLNQDEYSNGTSFKPYCLGCGACNGSGCGVCI